MTTPDAPAAVPGVEMSINGASALGSHARSGNVEAKRAAILGTAAALGAHARTLDDLAAAMAETGSNYGPEIWEPLLTAAAHLRAGVTVLAENDSRLEVLAAVARKLREAGVQAPDRGELSETGAR